MNLKKKKKKRCSRHDPNSKAAKAFSIRPGFLQKPHFFPVSWGFLKADPSLSQAAKNSFFSEKSNEPPNIGCVRVCFLQAGAWLSRSNQFRLIGTI